MTKPRHLLLDYGQVVCLPQSAADMERLAELAGLSVPELAERYWLWREPYDRGGSVRAYWTSVLGGAPTDQQLRQLAAQDTGAWMHLDPVVLELIADVRASGVAVSLLSNAPHELAQALARHEAFESFEHLLFSAELGMTKPDARIFVAALGLLGASPADVVFVDDRPQNVEAAAAQGLLAIHYTGHQDLEKVRAAVLD